MFHTKTYSIATGGDGTVVDLTRQLSEFLASAAFNNGLCTISATGSTYAISTMGADHTSGYTIAPEILACGGDVDQFDADKAELVRAFQYTTAFIDTSGHCLFIAFPILDIAEGFEGLVEECAGVFGVEWTGDDVTRIGKEVLDREIAFTRAAGLTKADDRLPEFMKYEKLPPHNVVWDVPDETLDAVFGEA